MNQNVFFANFFMFKNCTKIFLWFCSYKFQYCTNFNIFYPNFEIFNNQISISNFCNIFTTINKFTSQISLDQSINPTKVRSIPHAWGHKFQIWKISILNLQFSIQDFNSQQCGLFKYDLTYSSLSLLCWLQTTLLNNIIDLIIFKFKKTLRVMNWSLLTNCNAPSRWL